VKPGLEKLFQKISRNGIIPIDPISGPIGGALEATLLSEGFKKG